MSLSVAHATGPAVRFRGLDTVWIQVTGTLCNIACRHCFIGCGPKSTSIRSMTVDEVTSVLEASREASIRELYYTGGEPFLHPDIRLLVERGLAVAAVTVVTNGLLLDDGTVAWAAERAGASRYAFDLRVSLDGMTAAQNDPVRGRGTFARVVAALERLGRADLSPVVTVVEHEEGLAGAESRTDFLAFVRSLGIRQPRVKFLPLLRIGREARRTHGYEEPLDGAPLEPAIEGSLLCASGRCVTADGVYTCPILVEHRSARLGGSLDAASRDLQLSWQACQSCVRDGLRCNT